MSNYQEALTKGMKLVNDSKNGRQEIQQIFDSLNKSIKEMTNGIEIKREIIDDLFKIRLKSSKDNVDRKHHALVASNGEKYVELAKWNETFDGYPCTIKFENCAIIGTNKKTLETGLQKLLKNIDIANMIYKMMNNPHYWKMVKY